MHQPSHIPPPAEGRPRYVKETEAGSYPPLVSIIIRSMGRSILLDALNSVAAQTYSAIEVVVIDAKGSHHPPLEIMCGGFPIRVISLGQPLTRSKAANLGLSNATGHYLLFLDDDDLLLPNHIDKLVSAFLDGHENLAVYTGVRLEDADGTTLKIFDDPYDPARLRGANFLPIHAVLFDHTLVDIGCHFDEALECLEDWDFWLQASRYTHLHHVPGVSAIYRVALGNSGLSLQSDPEKHVINRAALFAKWQDQFTPREWVESFFWFEKARDHSLQWVQIVENEIRIRDTDLARLQQEIHTKNADLARLQQEIHAQNTHTATLEADIIMLTEDRNHYRQWVQALLSSTSWKLTAPLRWISQRLRLNIHP